MLGLKLKELQFNVSTLYTKLPIEKKYLGRDV
jgi:hypothetical protein